MRRNDDAAKRSLLDQIIERSVPLLQVESGRPFNLLRTAIKQSVPTERHGEVEPPTYAFTSTESFLETVIQFVPTSDHWLLAILVSELVQWVWRETRGEGVFWMDHLGTMPIVVPHPHYQERMGFLVERIVAEAGDAGLVIERMADMNDLVYSTFGVSCQDISFIEG